MRAHPAPQATAACPECEGPVVTADRETICEDCGLVVDEHHIDHGPDWRHYDTDETNPKRTGAPMAEWRHDRGLSTEIGHSRDANGNQLSEHKKRHMGRLRRAHSRARFGSKRERNQAHGFTEVSRIVGALGLGTATREQACSLFRSAQAEDLLQGRSIEALAAASVYATCRCSDLVLQIGEVVAVAQVDRDRIRHVYQMLNSELGLPTRVQRPSDHVPRFANRIEAPDVVERRALELAESFEGTTAVSGASPTGLAAACLYRAGQQTGWMETQETIADAANVSAVTLRQGCYRLDDVEEVSG